MFTTDDLIYSYTRQQAIDDGVLIDANAGALDEVTRQFFKVPVAMTAAVFTLIDKAVKSRRHYNDYTGVWHDMMWLCFLAARNSSSSVLHFRVIITGVSRQKYHTFKVVMGPIGPDNPAPCMTVMLPDED